MKALFILFVLLGLISQGYAKDDTEATLIKGFTKWQANRIEKLIIDEALQSTFENPYVQKLFPYTKKNALNHYGISSERLIPILQYYIKKDIELSKRFVEQCIPNKLVSIVEDSNNTNDLQTKLNDFIDSLNKFSGSEDKNSTIADNFLTKNGACDNNASFNKTKFKDLIKTVLDESLDDEKKELINKTIVKVEELISKIKEKKQEIKEIEKKLFELKKDLSKDIDKRKQQLTALIKELKKLIKKDEIDNEALLKDINYFVNIQILFEENQETIKQLAHIYKDFQEVFNDEDQPYTISFYKVLKIIEEVSTFDIENYNQFGKLRNVGLFLAELADASDKKDPDLVADILNRYLSDDDAFIKKRDNNAFIVFKEDSLEDKLKSDNSIFQSPQKGIVYISSYYGFAYRNNDAIKFDNDRTSLFIPFGPVGLEFKLISFRDWFSILFNYSPIDLGNYIAKELDDEEYDAKLDDIVTKNIFFSFSLKKYPVALIVGRNINEDNDYISIAYDLPIFTLW